jgi:hypothetical protein
MQKQLQEPPVEFLQLLQQAWQAQQWIRLTLSKYRGDTPHLQKILLRPVQLKQQSMLAVVYRYQTKDITKNYSWAEFEQHFAQWISQFQQLNLSALGREYQLKYQKKQWQLSHHPVKGDARQTAPAVSDQQHDRQKKRWISPDRRFLQALGICDAEQQLIPSMARKWKQINKFVELFANAIAQAQLDRQSALHVVDFGAGKGYLTCAIYDYLQAQHYQPVVTGVELRDELVQFCQQVAEQCGYQQLQFFQGDVRSYQPAQTDVMIALHACDIATDFAIHTGIRLGAKVIMCAPCCHKELRPQLRAPSVLAPMLDYGVHAGLQAEMLTDSLRALLLQAYGYQTKLLEFVSLEHTSKNKMILATLQQQRQQPDPEILAQIAALKAFYGIEKHSLERLLNHQSVDQQHGCAC